MSRFIIFAVIACLVQLIESKSVDNFILGGRDAAVGQFPYFASIRYSDELLHGCGGGILNQRWVLTAAHCVLGTERAIFVGSISVNEGTRYDIKRGIPHPLFPPTLELIGLNYSNWHDIGLIETEQAIVFTDLVMPIRLAQRRVIGSARAVVAGLGLVELDRTWTIGAQATHLQYLRTNVITNSECALRARLYGIFEPRIATPTIYSGHICTLQGDGVGTCFADSGSPLLTSDGVVGVVVSGVLPCGRGSAPDIYVRVSTYLDWIESYISDV